MQQDTSVDAPADTLKFVRNMFRTRAIEPKTSAIRRFVAAIAMELAPNKAAFGERSASASATRQVMFEAGDAAIDLRIDATGKRFAIRGQVLGADLSGASAILLTGDTTVSTAVDDLGGFRFESVTAGEYSLTLRSATDEIVIESLLVK